jgi:hypothetical protein
MLYSNLKNIYLLAYPPPILIHLLHRSVIAWNPPVSATCTRPGIGCDFQTSLREYHGPLTNKLYAICLYRLKKETLLTLYELRSLVLLFAQFNVK